MNPKYNVDIPSLTEEQVRELLGPKASYTPEQHEIARLKYVIERLYEDVFSICYRHTSVDPSSGYHLNAEQLMARMKALMNVDEQCEDDDLDVALAKHYNYDERIQSVVEGDNHGGDCTAWCCSCERCYYENFYGVCTAPPSKAIGSALWGRLSTLNEQKKNVSEPTTK